MIGERELTLAERRQLHAARGYVCACPPDVALTTCAPCTARADAIAAAFADGLAKIRAEVRRLDRAEQLVAGRWTPAGAGLEVRLS